MTVPAKKRRSLLRHVPLKSQFRILTICILALMLLVQGIYFTGYANLTTQRVMTTATRQMAQAA